MSFLSGIVYRLRNIFIELMLQLTWITLRGCEKHPHPDLINDNVIDLFLFVDFGFALFSFLNETKRAQGLPHQIDVKHEYVPIF